MFVSEIFTSVSLRCRSRSMRRPSSYERLKRCHEAFPLAPQLLDAACVIKYSTCDGLSTRTALLPWRSCSIHELFCWRRHKNRQKHSLLDFCCLAMRPHPFVIHRSNKKKTTVQLHFIFLFFLLKGRNMSLYFLLLPVITYS